MSTINVIEQEGVERDYGFAGVEAIIDHSVHGRLLMCDAYGEDAMGAGCVRWIHGIAIRVQPDDTLESLHEDSDRWMTIRSGYDSMRPVLDWSGHMVAAVARAAGL